MKSEAEAEAGAAVGAADVAVEVRMRLKAAGVRVVLKSTSAAKELCLKIKQNL